jgi:peptide/nickel transport system permease protein
MRRHVPFLHRPDLALWLPALLLGIVFLIALFGPMLVPYDPDEINHLAVLQAGSAAHPFGTDEFGRDILSRLMTGIRPTMIVAFGASALAALGGVALGVIAGFCAGIIEFLVMRSCDILLSFPPILLALLVVGFWPSGIFTLTVTIGLIYVPHFARVAHAATLGVASQEFVEAERAMGASPARLVLRDILPNILSSLVVQATLTVAAAILLESGLSFLGLGIKPPTASWGQMIGTARGYLAQSPMYTFWPSLCLAVTVLAINLLGDRLRDILDPQTV